MPAPQTVIDLVHRFDSQLTSYKSGRYNETELRRDFLDPLFEALGWDVRNTANAAEKYRDVIHEQSVEVGGQAKSADYLFKIGATPAFFVEAKKPGVNIETDPAPAFQLKSYAWSKKLPFSLLTDFEQLAFYDCNTRPVYDASPALGRIALYHFHDYLTRWEEIAARISRAAVTSGAFDTFVQGVKGKRGTTDVDDAFLAEMERWRDLLAHNLALRNPAITQRQLNFAVQTTIDRLIFLRICEDRGIEPEETLRNATDGVDVYGDILELFKKADKRYNSGLFHFAAEKNRPGDPDTFTPSLKIDDKVFKDILANLYLPKSPYRFNYFSADILGQVYERFLGKVITLSKTGHRAEVQEKPEVRKAGGVYYTPTYIVDYIVKNTVGELLKDKTPETLKTTPLRVLDPACGSGSFLLGAYQFLMDWYLDWYTHNDPAKHAKGAAPAVIEVPGGWQLTLEKKKEILTRHIYGVDIDSQAVEVTKLSLLLKVVENPGQLSLFSEERLLPDLGGNIKCGNSLIGPDFYENQQGTLFDTEEQYRVNAFDWHTSFPQVFRDGGFDAVIGNPPYGADLTANDFDYIKRNFSVAEYQIDTYPLFIEKATLLAKKSGFCGVIVPTAWVGSKYDLNLRFHLLKKTKILKVAIAPKHAFEDATVETMVLVFQSIFQKNNTFLVDRWDKAKPETYNLNQDQLLEESIFPIYAHPEIYAVVKKIRSNNKRISDFAEVVWGIKVYQKGKGKPPQKGFESDKKIFHSRVKVSEDYKPLLGGSEVNRFSLSWKGDYIKYGIWLAEPRTSNWFTGERILIREVTSNGIIQAAYVNDDFVFSNSIDGVRIIGQVTSYFFLLGLLNSQVISFYHLNSSANAFKGAFPKLLLKDILGFPVPDVSINQKRQLEKIVESMLTLHKQLAAARLPDEKERLQRTIAATDHQIDQLVYKLYDLTPEEIKIVEGA